MTNSMTAFSRVESATELGECAWELRTVNHRYLEMVFRIPDELRRFEPGFRSLISSNLTRGRMDAQFRYKADETVGDDMQLDTSMVGQLAAFSDQIRASMPDARALGVVDVLNWPGVIKTREFSVEDLGAMANELLTRGLSEIGSIRRQEGEKLGQMVRERIDTARTIVESIEPLAAGFGDRFRERLSQRLEGASVKVDPERLEQEVVIFLQKADIDEELDRLKMHMDEVASVLEQSKPSGRRLDFLMQELNREANTLGSKASDKRVSRAAVDLKVLIEQMREQIQNVE